MKIAMKTNLGGAGRRAQVGVGLGLAATLLLTMGSVYAQGPDDGNGPPPADAGQNANQNGGQNGGGRGFGGGGFGGGGGQNGGGPGGRFGGPGGQGMMPATVSRLPFDLLSSSLHLSDDQRNKIAIILIEARDADTTQGQPGGRNGGNANLSASRQKMRAADAAVQHQVEALLNNDQKPRLQTTLSAVRTLGAAGVPMFAVAKQNLTDKQVDDLAAASPTAAPDPGGADGANGGPPDPSQRQATRRAARQAVKSVLSADQQSAVSIYLDRAQTAQLGGPGDNGGPGGNGGGFGGGGNGGPGGPGGPGDNNMPAN